jgi:hypothetical protein
MEAPMRNADPSRRPRVWPAVVVCVLLIAILAAKLMGFPK